MPYGTNAVGALVQQKVVICGGQVQMREVLPGPCLHPVLEMRQWTSVLRVLAYLGGQVMVCATWVTLQSLGTIHQMVLLVSIRTLVEGLVAH